MKGHIHAHRIIERAHFKKIYERNPEDIGKNPDAAEKVFYAIRDKFGLENVKIDRYPQKGGNVDFPVLMDDERVVSSVSLSSTLLHLPLLAVDFVFVAPGLRDEAVKWLEKNRAKIITQDREET